MAAPASSAAPLDLKPLTALRFFAALWVVGYHYWPHLTAAPAPTWQDKGYLGVELFFVLSGFILAHVYLPQFGAGRFRYGSFLWARLSRIYPLHLAILAGLVVLAVGLKAIGVQADQLARWGSIPAQLLLVQAWGLGQDGGWNHPAWSISAEWFAYLTFPAFAMAAWPLRNRPLLAVGLAAALVLGLNFGFNSLNADPLTHMTLQWGALRIVPCFALGVATWLAWSRFALTRQSWAVGATVAAVLAIAAGAVFGLADPVMVLLFGGLIFAMGSLTTARSKLFTAKPLVWLGEVSFAVYMVCIPWELICTKAAEKVLHLPEATPLPPVLWAAMFVGVVPVAAVAHHLVERPARTMMRGWEARRAHKKARMAMAVGTA